MRNTDLNTVIFPTSLKSICFEEDSSDETKRYILIKGRKAIVNIELRQALGVVSDSYRLVSNELAIEYGKKCMSLLFPAVNTNKFKIFNIITPSTRSSCHIDLIYEGYEVNIFKKEVYLPLIRVTNSYNTSKALKFNIGFCRKICDNGVIFESEVIEFYFSHTKNQIKESIEFDIKSNSLKNLEEKFTQHLNQLNKTEIDQKYVIPLVCKVLELSFDIDAKNGKIKAMELNRFKEFRREIDELTDKYFKSLENTVYAVFAIITDYGSNNEQGDKRKALKINGFQKRAGNWLESFNKTYSAYGFSWNNYLSNYLTYM